MKQIKMYKIRDKNTGLFSKGSSYIGFSKAGKVWNGMGPLKNHINALSGSGQRAYANAEIVEMEMSVVDIIDMQKFIEDMKVAHDERDAKRELARENRLREAREAQYLKLKKEFG